MHNLTSRPSILEELSDTKKLEEISAEIEFCENKNRLIVLWGNLSRLAFLSLDKEIITVCDHQISIVKDKLNSIEEDTKNVNQIILETRTTYQKIQNISNFQAKPLYAYLDAAE